MSTSGTSGSSGLDGWNFGTSGTSGLTGSSGTSGLTGSSGTSGVSGLIGSSGTSGVSGSSGSSGLTGSSGTSGVTGTGGTSGTSGTSGVSYLEVPSNSKSANYTTVLDDSGKNILHPSADTTARTWTIPANATVAYPLGSVITFVNQNGAGVITIAITTDIMRLAGPGTTGSRTLAANGVASALKITTTEWIISGTNLT